MASSLLSEQIAAFAESIVNTLRQTEYQHDEQIDAAAGVYDCDGGGFVGFVLQAVAPDQYGTVPAETGRPRPRAPEYYEWFLSPARPSSGGWRRIPLLPHVRRGDIVAWRFTEVGPGHDAGHVCVAAGAPIVVDGPRVLAVRVYDSTDTPHFDDSRGVGPGQFPNGVGSGLINFTVDEVGRPLAFQFAPSEPFTALPVAVGRVTPTP